MSKRKLKIIFLDVDGVMVSDSSMIRTKYYESREGFLHSEHVDALNMIIDTTDAYIVLTSTYRLMSSLKVIKQVFGDSGIDYGRVISKTRNLNTIRGTEIKDWLDNCGDDVEVIKYVVIDDSVDMNGINWSNFVNTKPEYGLTYVEAERAINILNK